MAGKRKSLVIVNYPMFGDADPETWITEILDKAKASNKISAYQGISIQPGSYGVQNIKFIMEVGLTEPESQTYLSSRGDTIRLFIEAKKIADDIVGDTDTKIDSVTFI